MKSIRYFLWAALFGLSILLAGCGLGDGATLTPTPEPISELATHAKKPDIRGRIVKMIVREGELPYINIEGPIENETRIDKAFAKIELGTLIFQLLPEGYEKASVDDIHEGINVEVLYSGEVLEKFPRTGNAGEILIIP